MLVQFLLHLSWQNNFEYIKLTEFNIKHLPWNGLKHLKTPTWTEYSYLSYQLLQYWPSALGSAVWELFACFHWTEDQVLKVCCFFFFSNFSGWIYVSEPTNMTPASMIDSSASDQINSKAHSETSESFCHNASLNHSVVILCCTFSGRIYSICPACPLTQVVCYGNKSKPVSSTSFVQ